VSESAVYAVLADTAMRRALTRPARTSSDFDLNPGLNPGLNPPAKAKAKPLRDAGVLVAIWLRDGGTLGDARVILTQRSAQLRQHPGQVAFAGGKVDNQDDGPIAAALREAREEIALPPEQVEVIGTLAPHETVTGFRVLPVLGLVRGGFTAIAEANEVAEVFAVPLPHLLDLGRYRIEQRRWQGVTRRYYTVPWGPYYIWGATARILHGLAERHNDREQSGATEVVIRP
jgi:8-oxo-dGTP pyrophosphatase MutT (NUDIX family)